MPGPRFRSLDDPECNQPLSTLGLKLDTPGSPLALAVKDLYAGLKKAGYVIKPRVYLSLEWGVDDGTIAIGVPFYLADPDLIELHRRCVGLVEGENRADLLRYLRHETGHAIGNAYKLVGKARWKALFGDPKRPYELEYEPDPLAERYLAHLPGWYAQMHPEEDWAEVCGACLDPGRDPLTEFADAKGLLPKIKYTVETLAAVRTKKPLVSDQSGEDEITTVAATLKELYTDLLTDDGIPSLRHLRGALVAALHHRLYPKSAASGGPLVASLLTGHEPALAASIYRASALFPERVIPVTRKLARAASGLRIPTGTETEVMCILTTLLLSIAMRIRENEDLRPVVGLTGRMTLWGRSGERRGS